MNMNINIEEATNGVVLRGRIGTNGEFNSEVFPFSNPDWRIDLTNRLTNLESQYQSDVTDQITGLQNQIDDIEIS
jgi:ribonucleotide reductase beta subunit family protein with ferritin-like domain